MPSLVGSEMCIRDRLISGHTHEMKVSKLDKKFLINPGSTTGAYSPLRKDAIPTFMILEFKEKTIEVYLYQLTANDELKIDQTQLVRNKCCFFFYIFQIKFKYIKYWKFFFPINILLLLLLNIAQSQRCKFKLDSQKTKRKKKIIYLQVLLVCSKLALNLFLIHI
eukprot:TRINITY_DN5884_c0_g1_i4.p1 TRINITY_DN5884_c0_g1~~TRINITY_DN5884_c0_g1_i4.p1  ORF type:complete len:165 (-),score=31.61 TRINITY_DN5884_c0_g1_i4:145-639(-)